MQRSGNYCSLVIKFMFKQISLVLIEMHSRNYRMVFLSIYNMKSFRRGGISINFCKIPNNQNLRDSNAD